jgi:hypothetical protein
MTPNKVITILLREIKPTIRTAMIKSRIGTLFLALVRNTKSDRIPTTNRTDRISKAPNKAMTTTT